MNEEILKKVENLEREMISSLEGKPSIKHTEAPASVRQVGYIESFAYDFRMTSEELENLINCKLTVLTKGEASKIIEIFKNGRDIPKTKEALKNWREK
jgi:hypothetical protein